MQCHLPESREESEKCKSLTVHSFLLLLIADDAEPIQQSLTAILASRLPPLRGPADRHDDFFLLLLMAISLTSSLLLSFFKFPFPALLSLSIEQIIDHRELSVPIWMTNGRETSPRYAELPLVNLCVSLAGLYDRAKKKAKKLVSETNCISFSSYISI
jgi:hypothetical protein